MSISDCPECKELLDQAAAAMKRHLEAIGRVSAAVREATTLDPDGLQADGSRLDGLQKEVDRQREARMDAFERYENHLCSHQATARAGAASGARM